jgi:hypothetical protein
MRASAPSPRRGLAKLKPASPRTAPSPPATPRRSPTAPPPPSCRASQGRIELGIKPIAKDRRLPHLGVDPKDIFAAPIERHQGRLEKAKLASTTSTSSRSTRPSPPRSSATSRNSTSPSPSSTSAAAASRWAPHRRVRRPRAHHPHPPAEAHRRQARRGGAVPRRRQRRRDGGKQRQAMASRETAAHTARAHRSFLLAEVPDPQHGEDDFLQSDEFLRIETECLRFGVGLATFVEPDNLDTWTVRVRPPAHRPDPSLVENWLSQCFAKNGVPNELSQLIDSVFGKTESAVE